MSSTASPADQPTIRVVLDTSVLISGALSFFSYIRRKFIDRTDPDLSLEDDRLADARVLAVAFGGGMTVVFSEALKNELNEVVNRDEFKEQFLRGPAEILRDIYLDRSIHVEPSRSVRRCRDPKDDFLLDAALEALATYLISNDKDLLALKCIGSTRIVSPRGFLAAHEWRITSVFAPETGQVAFSAVPNDE